MKVNIVSKQTVFNWILERIKTTNGSYICVANVHMCMEAFDSPDFCNVVNNSNIVIPDGRPLYWAQYIMGNVDCEQVRGQDITDFVCQSSSSHNLRIGLYGGRDDAVLAKVVSKLERTYPGIEIVYKFSPPFRSLTDSELCDVISDISKSECDVLFVGIGCPKQEIWMAENASKTSCVMIGIGAAFDFISGEKRHAPVIMQKLGLEWLFRLACEPKRLWRRYLYHNPRFIFHLAVRCIFHLLSTIRSRA